MQGLGLVSIRELDAASVLPAHVLGQPAKSSAVWLLSELRPFPGQLWDLASVSFVRQPMSR